MSFTIPGSFQLNIQTHLMYTYLLFQRQSPAYRTIVSDASILQQL